MSRRVTCAALLAGTIALTLSAADILTQLGLKPQQAKDILIFSVTHDVVQYDLVRHAFKAATPEARATLVKGVLEWARAAVDTPEFATAYAKFREERKPKPPKPVSGEIDEGLKQQKKALEDLKKQLPTMAPDMRKAMEETIRQMEAQMATQESPAMKAQMQKIAAVGEAEQQQAYAKQLTDYEEKFPADVHKLVAVRLQRFLDVCADVDYNAALTGERTKRFANAKYEEKPPEWKLCYRAGKPAVDAMRAFATGWIASLRKTQS